MPNLRYKSFVFEEYLHLLEVGLPRLNLSSAKCELFTHLLSDNINNIRKKLTLVCYHCIRPLVRFVIKFVEYGPARRENGVTVTYNKSSTITTIILG